MTPAAYIIPGLEKNEIKQHDLPVLLNSTSRRQKRDRDLVIPRQIVMALAATFFCTQSEAGRLFGKDHATVVYSLNTIANAIEVKDSEVMVQIVPLFRQLYYQHKSKVRCFKDLTPADKINVAKTGEKLKKYRYAKLLTGIIKATQE